MKRSHTQKLVGKYTVKTFATGDIEWWYNGHIHREDGPAWERANGDKVWYLNGRLHREDGPAMDYGDGEKSWWLNGVNYPLEKEWKREMRKRKLKALGL